MIHVPDNRPTDSQRQLDDLSRANREATIYGKDSTPLSKGLNELQQAWLLQYATDRWGALHGVLGSWRLKMAKYERMAEDDYSDRANGPDKRDSDAPRSVFEHQNRTLGLVSGFADFAHAQAKDDIFGVKPWFVATPQGANDVNLAQDLTKHSQWKFDQSNLEVTLHDALRLACDLGTAFVKLRWCRETDVSEALADVAIDVETEDPILGEGGEYITTVEELAEDADPASVGWKEMLIENTTMVYDNIEGACLDWKNVAFEPTAPELDLRYTDFMVRFKMGVHDLCDAYGLDDAQKRQLLALAGSEFNNEPREHRDEKSTSDRSKLDSESNPEIYLVEGFLRCDPRNTGRPSRVHVIFSPTLYVMFRCDYLRNVTPGGILPVFPIRGHKVPRRIIGRGYYEKFEDANNGVDEEFNKICLRNRVSGEVFKGFNRDALKDEAEGDQISNSPTKLFELKSDKKMADFLSFAVVPDNSNRSDSLMNQMLQMAQMRSGITSASQGELKGVPNANTATGVQQMMSRGATLVKEVIDTMTSDLRPAVEFAVHLNYANQDQDETFTWGEGKDSELISIKANDVRGLRANVSLTLTRAQNFSKLESAKAAIELATAYAGLLEPEKIAQRRLYIQAIQSLGFNDADRIIREAVVDPQSVAALLPQEMQQPFAQFLASMGLGRQVQSDPETPEVAPVSGGDPA